MILAGQAVIVSAGHWRSKLRALTVVSLIPSFARVAANTSSCEYSRRPIRACLTGGKRGRRDRFTRADAELELMAVDWLGPAAADCGYEGEL